MRKTDLRRKHPTAWPWIVGLLALALALWGITILLAPPEEPEKPEVGPVASDTLPPAPIPMADGGANAGSGRGDGLAALMPLGREDAGRGVTVSGVVVVTGNGRYWVGADSVILLVEGPRAVRKGDSVSVRGTLREGGTGEALRTAQEVLAADPVRSGWPIVEALRLVADPAAAPAPDSRGDSAG